MVYAPTPCGEAVGAEWRIWPNSSVPFLSKALDKELSAENQNYGKPILQQSYYLNQEQIDDAVALGGATPWVYHQKPEEVLIIPPGFPYQVNFQSVYASQVLKELQGTQ